MYSYKKNRKNPLQTLILLISILVNIPTFGNAQNNITNTKISISFSNASVTQALDDIKMKMSVNFSYSSDLINPSQKISQVYKNVTLKELLHGIFGAQLQHIRVNNNQVILQLNKSVTYGNLYGQITNKDGIGIANVEIQVSGTSLHNFTDAEGNFQLYNLPAGKVQLTLIKKGLNTYSVSEEIISGKTLSTNILFAQNQGSLEDVSVQIHNHYYEPSTTLRLNTSYLETPQNIVVAGQQTFKDIGALDLSDILRTSSGTYVGYGNGQDIYIGSRGTISSNNHLRNGVGGGYTFYSSEDIGMIERAEFIKGPSSFMVSNVYPNGLLNIVTKQPTDERVSNFNLGFGSFNMMRATMDLGGKITKDSALTYRLNAGIQNQNQYFQFGYFKKYYLAGAIKYRMDKNTNVTFEYNRTYNHQQDDPMMLPTIDGKFYTLPQDFTMSDPNSPGLFTYDNYYRVNIIHKLNDKWSLNGQASYLSSDFSGYNMTQNYMSADYDTMYRSVIHNHTSGSQSSAQLFLSGQFNSGEYISHKLLVGLDIGKTNWTWRGAQFLGTDGSLALSMNNPQYYVPIDSIENFGPGGLSITQNSYSALFVQDAVTFWEKLILTFGGRMTHNIQNLNSAPYQIKNNKFTPRVGLTYLLTSNMSMYAMYDQSFVPQTGTDFNGNAFKPLYGIDKEIGFKGYFFGKDLVVSADVYQIIMNNNLTTDVQHPNYSVQTGQVKNKGVEVDINGNITPNLRVIANYAYSKTKITKDNDPSLVGMPNWGASPNIGNLFLKYSITKSTFKGLNFGVGSQYTDKTYWNSDLTHTIPAYMLLQASLGYNFPKFYINMSAFNLTNKKYATYGYMTGAKDWSYQRGTPTNIRIDFGFHI